MSHPAYIDRDGEVWTYGPDYNGDIGYHVDGGLRFPFAAEEVPDLMTFEQAFEEFGFVSLEDVTPAHETYRRLRDASTSDGKVTVSADDLELVLRGWVQWYRARLDLIRKSR